MSRFTSEEAEQRRVAFDAADRAALSWLDGVANGEMTAREAGLTSGDTTVGHAAETEVRR